MHRFRKMRMNCQVHDRTASRSSFSENRELCQCGAILAANNGVCIASEPAIDFLNVRDDRGDEDEPRCSAFAALKTGEQKLKPYPAGRCSQQMAFVADHQRYATKKR